MVSPRLKMPSEKLKKSLIHTGRMDLQTRNQHTYFVIDRINQQRVGEVQFDTDLRKHGIKGAWLFEFEIYDAFGLRE